MRATAFTLSVLFATTPTVAVRADDIANLSGTWKLVSVADARACGVESFFPDTGLQERRKNGDGSASRRSELSYPIEPICVSGQDQRSTPDYVLTVRQEGPAVTMESVITGGPSRLSRVREFTIGARKATTGRDGIQTKARVESQTLILRASH
jgi:hypothetical protein